MELSQFMSGNIFTTVKKWGEIEQVASINSIISSVFQVKAFVTSATLAVILQIINNQRTIVN